MNLLSENSSLSLPRQLNSDRYKNREMSSSANSKMTYSLCSVESSNRTKNSQRMSMLIEWCVHPDESYVCRTIRKSFLSHRSDLLKLHDQFGCNALMYCLRYQRYQLFELLLNETTQDVSLRQQDKQGNTILHYTVLYGGDNTHIIDQLVEHFNKFLIEIDDRNHNGFTALLLAAFCGRYDFVLSLLKNSNASPFVRDHVLFKNVFDYIEIDTNSLTFNNQTQQYQHTAWLSRASTRLRVQLHRTIPVRQEDPLHAAQHQINANFFEIVLPRVIQNQSDVLRSSILDLQKSEHLNLALIHLLNYLNQRYPRITNLRLPESPQSSTEDTKLSSRENGSKADIHAILDLFDPNMRPKVMSLESPTHKSLATTKAPISFKRLSAKITTIATFSRMPIDKNGSSFLLIDSSE